MLNPFYQPHRPPEAKPPRLNLAQKIVRMRHRRLEKKKLEESAFAAALDSVEAEEPVDQALGISVAEKQVDAAESAQATASLAVLEADTEARLSTLRGDRAQTGICRFFRAGSGSSESSLFVTPTKKRGRPAFGSQTPDQVLAADKRLALREAERGVAEAKSQLAALKREVLAQEEKQVLPSPTPPTAKKRPGRPRKEASGETQLVFSAASSHGRQRGRHIKCATPLPKEKLANQTAVDTAASQLPPRADNVAIDFLGGAVEAGRGCRCFLLAQVLQPSGAGSRAHVPCFGQRRAEQERRQALLAKAQQPS